MPTNKRQKLPAAAAAAASSSVGRQSLPRRAAAAARQPRKNDDYSASFSGSEESEYDADEATPPAETPSEAQSDASGSRKRKAAPSSRSSTKSSKVKDAAALRGRLFGNPSGAAPISSERAHHVCVPPTRQHSAMYHRPLLLDGQRGRDGRRSLLSWFDSVSESRSMPWRKAWVNPREVEDVSELRQILEKRAYEVWISEIMLQQTRVAVVIDYWNKWMDKWPTIHDLAAAKSEDVLAAWSGLGYYSRATRIHEGAKLAAKDPAMKGLLPASAKELQAKMPGVGPYTAGAISSIVFGRPEPMVDGNVLRVLSRQLGIHGNIKTDKAVIDTIWAAADAVVKATAALDGNEKEIENHKTEDNADGEPVVSDRPGRWGQALMELGSTVCTPKPNCSKCPITSTCRVYEEGQALASKTKDTPGMVDIEDLCILCESFEDGLDEQSDEDAPKSSKTKTATSSSAKTGIKSAKQSTLEAFAAFAFTRSAAASKSSSSSTPKPSKQSEEAKMDIISNHARRFPVKVVKKAVREEETLVCAIRRRSDGRYLIHRRPEKGLLAGLWELPSHILEPAKIKMGTSAKQRKQMAQSYVSGLLPSDKGGGSLGFEQVGELGSVPWLFSHIKLTMHVHLFTVDDVDDADDVGKQSRWVVDAEEESMGTGMRKCWAMVKDAA